MSEPVIVPSPLESHSPTLSREGTPFPAFRTPRLAARTAFTRASDDEAEDPESRRGINAPQRA